MVPKEGFLTVCGVVLRGPFVSIVICYRDGGFKLYDGSCCKGGGLCCYLVSL